MKPALFVGGGNFGEFVRTLQGGVQIAVGTVGTVKSLVQKGKLVMDQCRFFVLDEADQVVKPVIFSTSQTRHVFYSYCISLVKLVR